MDISSRIPGFYKMTVEERKEHISTLFQLDDVAKSQLNDMVNLPENIADKMIENVIGTFSLPLGLGLNFLIDGKDYVIPMAVEEPSIIASASYIAKIVREAGGFKTEATDRIMIGQIQVVGCPDFEKAKQAVLDQKEMLIKAANDAYPSLVARGGGAVDLDVRIINEDGSKYTKMLVVHIYVNTCDAMGANIINTMAESLAPVVEHLTEGKVYLRILSNFADQCLAKATCVIPPHLLETDSFTGEEVRDGVVLAYEFAASDPYRAVTHNKGIMNGIDAVLLATGNDWRAVEAGVHAYAAKSGQYRSLSRWTKDEEGNLVGELKLPVSVGSVGGTLSIHPGAQFAYRLLGQPNANELSRILVAVGLAQNLSAVRALVTEGIQKGHMSLQARSLAIRVGATGENIERVAQLLQEAEHMNSETAKNILDEISK